MNHLLQAIFQIVVSDVLLGFLHIECRKVGHTAMKTASRKACAGIGTHRRFAPRFSPSERTKSLLPPFSPTTAESWWRCNNGGNSSGTMGRGESERVRNLQQDL